MKKYLVLILILVIADLSYGQFRRKKRATATKEEGIVDYSAVEEYEIGEIEITGVEILSTTALTSMTGLRVGDRVKIPGDDLTQAIRKLYNHGLVGDAAVYIEEIGLGKVKIIIELAERPRLTSYAFLGVNKSQESELKDELDLNRGRVLSESIVKNTEIAVRKYFVKKGFLNTHVDIKREVDTLARQGIRLVIDVDKKSKVKINRVFFEGNQAFMDGKLKGKLKSTNEKVRFHLPRRLIAEIFSLNGKKAKEFLFTKEEVGREEVKEFLSETTNVNLFKSSKYIEDDFNEDKFALISFYNSKGYRDAEVVEDTVYNHDDNTINVGLRVDEGKRYYFRDINWVGNYIYNDRVLTEVLDIDKGDVYDIEKINQKLSFNPKGTDISGLYMDNGYLFFQVDPIEVGIENDSIDIEMRVREGDQATIDKVTVTGNDKTNDHVIYRVLQTVPGRKFSRADLIRTQQTLAQMGFFDPEQIGQNILPNPSKGTVDIDWSVVEKSNDQIELSAGWGGSLGFVGTLGLVFNNFSLRNVPHFDKWKPLPTGDGQRLQIRMQSNGKPFQSYTFSFTEPWLGGKKPTSFTLSLNQSIQRLATTNVTNLDSHLKVSSITAGIGKQLEWPDNYFVLQNTLGYTIYDMKNYNFGGLNFPEGTGRSRSLTYNVTLSRNSVDNPMFPKLGSTVSLSATFTPPYSSWNDIDYSDESNPQRYEFTEYHKWMFDTKHYVPLVGKMVLEASYHFGYLGSYNQETGIGPFERFQLGGDGLAGQNFILGYDVIGLRGYTNNSITPKPVGGIEGGVAYNKLSMELRYPVTTGNAATIYVFGFAEAGNNWGVHSDIDLFNLYRSAGFGARVFMPAFGLIGLNWGYGFDPIPGNPSANGAQFHFTIGQQLR